MIVLDKLSKIYRTIDVETTALNEISLEVKQGEFVSIMGESGCGKSTLLNIIGLLDTPSSGGYKFSDVEVSGYTERERAQLRKKNIGFIFQSFNLIDELTVAENVELPLVYLKRDRSERRAYVSELLKRVGIAHRAGHYPQQLSGGQQQRVAIARAIVAKPMLLLADEPTGNLDSKHGNEVMELLTQLNEGGTTIIMVTHSQHDADYSSRTIRLVDGRIAAESHNRQPASI